MKLKTRKGRKVYLSNDAWSRLQYAAELEGKSVSDYLEDLINAFVRPQLDFTSLYYDVLGMIYKYDLNIDRDGDRFVLYCSACDMVYIESNDKTHTKNTKYLCPKCFHDLVKVGTLRSIVRSSPPSSS